ncbi:MAG: AI-2E family transporter [Acetobacterales bacterium]
MSDSDGADPARISGPAGDAPARDGGQEAGAGIPIRSRAVTWLLVLALMYTAYFAQDVLIPIAIAFLLNLLLAPPVRVISRRLRIPHAVTAGLTVATLLAVLVGAFYALAAPTANWLNTLPTALAGVEYKLQRIYAPVREVEEAAKQVEKLARNNDDASPAESEPLAVVLQGPSLTQTVLGQTTAISAGTMVTTILLLFLLASGDTLLRQAISITPQLGDKKRIVEIVRDTEDDISWYLLTISLINAGLGAAVGTALWLLDVPNPVLWGVMAAILNYVPFVGGLVGVSVVTLVCLVTFETTVQIVAPPLAYLVLNGIEGQLVTPALVARRLALNPVAVFVSLIMWSWLWGIPGALLAVPMLAAFKIACDRTEGLQPIGIMLGRAPTPPE